MKRDAFGKFAPKGAKKVKTYYQPEQEKMVTLVNYILDQSGSMSSVKAQVLSGFSEYIQGLKQKLDNESKLLFSLSLFDSSGSYRGVRIMKPYVVTDINKVIPLDNSSYKPEGQTPLYDAIGKTVASVDEVIKDKGLKIHRILTVIHTDGQENDSNEYTMDSIKKLIAEKEATNHWSFVYIGASPTTWADSNRLGINKMNTMAYDPAKTTAMFGMAASSTMQYRSMDQTQTRAFFAAGEKILGDGSHVKAAKRHEHLSSDGNTKYTATKWQDGTWSCNCPGWSNRKSCKHIGGGVSAL